MSTKVDQLGAAGGYQPPAWSAAAPAPPSKSPSSKAAPVVPTATAPARQEPADRFSKHAQQVRPGQQPRWLLDPKAPPESQGLRRRPAPPPKGELKVKEMKRSDMKRSAADIKTEDMIKLFGPDGVRLKEMAKDRPDITIGNLMRLKRVGIDQIYDATKLLSTRRDLNLNDIIDQAGNGNALLKPATFHSEGRALLDQRAGTRPDDLSQMGDQFRHSYGDQAGRAFGKAADLLHYRQDLSTHGLEAKARELPAGSVSGADGYQALLDNYRDGRHTNHAHNLIN